ncbi:MAG TPA: AarF/UbiB family protein [Desulfobacteria bacterium]|nr:AarF/UbiB family protein [Desulfobacteria bacterium]
MSLFGKLPYLKENQVISGQWERNSYKVLKLLGSGGNGAVYLVEDGAGLLKALKFSMDLFGLNSEYRVLVFLRSCSELQSLNAIPAVFEIDDCQINSKTYYFIVMEYCQGENLRNFRGRLGIKDAALVARKVAVFLECLHRTGFVFGDLKPGNIIFNFKTEQIYIIDYGSVTVKGGKLRQFTPSYDRATWQAGARVADESYDMFSLGMLLVVLVSGNVRRGRYKHPDKVIEEISGRIPNSAVREVVRKALSQNALTCKDIVCRLSVDEIETGFSQNSVSRLKKVLINLVGLASVASLIMSLIYFKQFH